MSWLGSSWLAAAIELRLESFSCQLQELILHHILQEHLHRPAYKSAVAEQRSGTTFRSYRGGLDDKTKTDGHDFLTWHDGFGVTCTWKNRIWGPFRSFFVSHVGCLSPLVGCRLAKLPPDSEMCRSKKKKRKYFVTDSLR